MPDDPRHGEFPAEEPGSDTLGKRTRRQFLKDMTATGAGLAASGFLGGEALAAGGEVALSNGPLPVSLVINGSRRKLALDPRTTVLDLLREELQLTGTKKGCDHGQCGACTVLIDGRRVNSCLTLAVMHPDAQITTIEGLGTPEALHPMQAAFVRNDAFQCGYCTPGQICSAVGLLGEGHPADDAAIREGMAGNLCRCGAYPNIVSAIREVRDQGADLRPRA